jgi:hypothetical protein
MDLNQSDQISAQNLIFTRQEQKSKSTNCWPRHTVLGLRFLCEKEIKQRNYPGAVSCATKKNKKIVRGALFLRGDGNQKTDRWTNSNWDRRDNKRELEEKRTDLARLTMGKPKAQTRWKTQIFHWKSTIFHSIHGGHCLPPSFNYCNQNLFISH